jgi:hypothetical protein
MVIKMRCLVCQNSAEECHACKKEKYLIASRRCGKTKLVESLILKTEIYDKLPKEYRKRVSFDEMLENIKKCLT